MYAQESWEQEWRCRVFYRAGTTPKDSVPVETLMHGCSGTMLLLCKDGIRDMTTKRLESVEAHLAVHQRKLNMFDSRSSDGYDNQTNDRFKKDNEYHVVPPPLTRNYMPPLGDLSFAGLDDSIYSPTTNKTSASVSQVETSITPPSNTSVEMPRVEFVRPSGVIIEDCGNPHQALKYKGMFDSGCSRHMTGNKALLTDYQDIDRGFVAFGGSTRGGKITGIGKIRTKDEYGEDVDVHLYKSMIGSLMYLTSSRPDIMFSICACLRFQDSPLKLEAFSDSDYAGASLDMKSTTGGCQFLGSRLISWQCKKQTMVANSTTEAEYIAASHCCGQVLWIQNQMLDYGFNFMQTKIYVDNESSICVVKNPVYHSKTKHIEIQHHFIRDSYYKRLIEMVKIHTNYNVADLLTKDFDVTRFQFLIASIGMLNP
ncbi:hypothetical protein Tco_0391224 [Tanacetum coccineum]